MIPLCGLRARQDRLVCKALGSYPFLQQFFGVDSMVRTDLSGVCSHTQELSVRILNGEEEQ
eukprot:5173436-Pyramimonas_sp.AAC.1